MLIVSEMMQIEVVKKSHSLEAKTEDFVKRSFYFPNMKRYLENITNNCMEYIIVNKKGGKGGFLKPIPREHMSLST